MHNTTGSRLARALEAALWCCRGGRGGSGGGCDPDLPRACCSCQREKFHAWYASRGPWSKCQGALRGGLNSSGPALISATKTLWGGPLKEALPWVGNTGGALYCGGLGSGATCGLPNCGTCGALEAAPCPRVTSGAVLFGLGGITGGTL